MFRIDTKDQSDKVMIERYQDNDEIWLEIEGPSPYENYALVHLSLSQAQQLSAALLALVNMEEVDEQD